MNFYQIIYQFIFDILLGIASLLFLYYNISKILEFGHNYGSKIHIDVLSQEVEWLMGFPAGLKTNKNLNHFLGSLSLKIIYIWNYFTTFATPYEAILIRLVAISGILGFSIEMALISDFIQLITLHMYLLVNKQLNLPDRIDAAAESDLVCWGLLHDSAGQEAREREGEVQLERLGDFDNHQFVFDDDDSNDFAVLPVVPVDQLLSAFGARIVVVKSKQSKPS